MKSSIIAALSAVSTVSAHSWLGCTNQDNGQLRTWMEGNSTLRTPVIIDPVMPWYQYLCNGYPRNKANPGDWIDESTNYAWYLLAKKNAGDTHACHPNQRSPTYQDNAPMASAAPGSMIRLFFGGNGHTRGYNAPNPMGGDPGTVSVYWKGKPEAEIVDQKEFTKENLLQSQGFAADSFSYPADPNIKRPQEGLVDKGNWMELKLPSDMAPGRHMMVWVWDFAGAPQWSTCFDVMVSGQAANPAPETKSEPAASPAPVQAVPEPIAAAPAPVPQVPEQQQKNPTEAPAQAPAPVPAPAAPEPAPVVSSAPATPEAVAAPAVDTPPTEQPKPACRARYNRKHSRQF